VSKDDKSSDADHTSKEQNLEPHSPTFAEHGKRQKPKKRKRRKTSKAVDNNMNFGIKYKKDDGDPLE
jgi:hypothetical protein